MPATILADTYQCMTEKGSKGIYKDFIHYVACAIGLEPLSSTWSTSQHWTHLSTSLNLEVAPAHTLTQLSSFS